MKKHSFLKRLCFILLLINQFKLLQAQSPKLVVTLVVEQMRYEYLSRFAVNYGKSGLKELLNNGFVCPNTHVGFFPTNPSPGIASLYTGAPPSINGIPNNTWYSRAENKIVYCVQDSAYKTLAKKGGYGVSPKMLQSSTIGDELKTFTNFKTKVFSASLSDRSAVLGGGHSANGAFWYDTKTGEMISSSYYMKDLPEWVSKFNNDSLVDKYYQSGWNSLYPQDYYTNKNNENIGKSKSLFGNDYFPYNLTQFTRKNYGAIRNTPFGNTLLFEFAKRLIKNEGLGKGSCSDMLMLSLNATDIIGHNFTPNSVELEDTYLRLDLDISEFLKFLNETIGKENYVFILTSIHGVANNPSYLKKHNIPAGVINLEKVIENLEIKLKQDFGDFNWIQTYSYPYVFLNDQTLIDTKTDKSLVINQIQKSIESYDGVLKVLDLNNISDNLLEVSLRNKIVNGIYGKLAGDLLILLKPNYYEDFPESGTTHGSPYAYDTHVPLIWYGGKIKPQTDYTSIDLIDIAPTLSLIMGIQEPNASTGKAITQLLLNINQKK